MNTWLFILMASCSLGCLLVQSAPRPFLTLSTTLACTADVAFVIDNSGSIRDKDPPGGNNWLLIINFVKVLVQLLNVGPNSTHIGVVDFSDEGYLDFNFNAYPTEAEVLSALDLVSYKGYHTNTTGGLYIARTRLFDPKYGSRPNATDVIILITDGVPTIDVDKLQGEVDRIKEKNIKIVAVGVTNQINETLLRSIVTQPSSEHYFYAGDFNSLDSIKDQVINNKTCQPVVSLSAATSSTSIKTSSSSTTATPSTVTSKQASSSTSTTTTRMPTESSAATPVIETSSTAPTSPTANANPSSLDTRVATENFSSPVTTANAMIGAISPSFPLLNDSQVETSAMHRTLIGDDSQTLPVFDVTNMNVSTTRHATDFVIWSQTNTIATAASSIECLADVAFVIDNSGSIGDNDSPGGSNWLLIINFVKSLVRLLSVGPNGTHVGAVDFGNKGYLDFDFLAYSTEAEVLAAIDLIKYKGENSNTTGGLRVARTRLFDVNYGSRTGVAHIVILLTDGIPNFDKDLLMAEVNLIKSMNIRLIAVGVTKQVNETLLRSLVTQPASENYVFAETFDSLDFIKNKVVNGQTCQAILTTCLADVAFVIDNSGSIGDSDPPGGSNWLLIINFVKSLARLLNVGPNGTHVGAVDFGNKGYLDFDFLAYSTEAEVLAAIDLIKYKGENSNATGGLRVARTRLFDVNYGSRTGVAHIMILLTDGIPNFDKDLLMAEANLIKSMNIRLIAVGVTKQVNETLLQSIVTQPASENYIFAENYESLDFVKGQVINDQTCTAISSFPSSGATESRSTISHTNATSEMVVLSSTAPFASSSEIALETSETTTQAIGLSSTSRSSQGSSTTTQAIGLSSTSRSSQGSSTTTQAIGLSSTSRSSQGSSTTLTKIGTSPARTTEIITGTVPGTPVPRFSSAPLTFSSTLASSSGSITTRIIEDSSPATTFLSTSELSKSSPLTTETILSSTSRTTPTGSATTFELAATSATASSSRPPATSAEMNMTLSPAAVSTTQQISVSTSHIMASPTSPSTPTGSATTILSSTQSPSTAETLPFFTASTRPSQATVTSATGLSYSLFSLSSMAASSAESTLIGVGSPTSTVFHYNSTSISTTLSSISSSVSASATENTRIGAESPTLPTFADAGSSPTVISSTSSTALASSLTSNVTASPTTTTRTTSLLTPTNPTLSSTATRQGISTATSTQNAIFSTQTMNSEDCASGADVVFALTMSRGVDETEFKYLKSYLTAVISAADVGGQMRFGVVMFTSVIEQSIDLNQYTDRASLIAAIRSLPYTSGGANTAAGLQYSRNRLFTASAGDRVDYPNVLILITKSRSSNEELTLEVAALSRRSGIYVIVIAIGSWLNVYEVNNIASQPHAKNTFFLKDYQSLNNSISELRNLYCNNTNACASNPCGNRGQCFSDRSTYICKCPSGFAGTDCEETCRQPFDIVFAVAASKGCGPENFQKMLDFIARMAVSLNLQSSANRMSVLTFADSASVRFHLDEFSTTSDILNAVSGPYQASTTNTAAGLEGLRQELVDRGRSGVTNLGVLLMFGRSTNLSATVEEASKTRSAGITLLTVAIGPNTDPLEMAAIASQPTSSNCLNVTDFDSLHAVEKVLFRASCNNVDECVSNPCHDGGRCVDQINGYACDCSNSTTGVNCERGCDGALDICLVIDASGSIRVERFPKVLDYVNSLIDQFEVSPSKTRISAVKYSDNAFLQFYLNTYTTKQDVQLAILRIKFEDGRTNTASGIAMMMNQVFTTANGDRPNVPNLAIVLTDGNSNINSELTAPTAIAARNSGVHIIVFGVGTDVNIHELRNIASEPIDQSVFVVETWERLPQLRDSMISATCDSRDWCASNPCQNRGTCRKSFKSFICECPTPFSGLNCDRNCPVAIDVVLVLDLSGSLDDFYDSVVEFAKMTVYGLPVGIDRVRVAVVTFSDNATIQFNLSAYDSNTAVRNALVFRRSGGKTNTQEAIRLSHLSVFSGSNGDRASARNVMAVVTDGQSNIDPGNTIQEADFARQKGIEVYAVGIGNGINTIEINGIASDPKAKHAIFAYNPTQVKPYADLLLNSLCQP